MDAMISGRNGLALVVDGGCLASIHASEPESTIPRHRSEVHSLLGEAQDFVPFENVSREEIVCQLVFAQDREHALQLALILLDPELSDDIRRDGADELEELFRQEKLIAYVEGVLYAEPLPETSDLRGGLEQARGTGAQKVAVVLGKLEASQPVITEVRHAWNAILPESFGGEERYWRFVAVREGLFRQFVQYRAAGKSASAFFRDAYMRLVVSSLPNSHAVLQAWIGPFLRHYEAQEGLTRPSERPQVVLEEDSKSRRRWSRESVAALKGGTRKAATARQRRRLSSRNKAQAKRRRTRAVGRRRKARGGARASREGKRLVLVGTLAASLLAVVLAGQLWGPESVSLPPPGPPAVAGIPGAIHPFNADLPYEDLLEPLADLRRQGSLDKPSFQRFERAVWSLNEAALSHTADRLGLSSSQRRRALERAEGIRQITAQNYYDDYRDLMGSTGQTPSGFNDFSYEISGTARDFSTILGKHLCDDTIFAFELNSKSHPAPAALLLSQPCSIVMTEVLVPLNKEMEESALLQDLVLGNEAITGHLRTAVVELATAKDEFSFDMSQTFARDIFGFTSEAQIQVTVIARVKAGFDLDRFFSYEIDSATQEFIVTLPEPELLSVEVHPDIDKIEDGWFVTIDEQKLSSVLADAPARARLRAEKTGLLVQAKENAEVVVRQLFAPLANTPRVSYGVKVRFRTSPPQAAEPRV